MVKGRLINLEQAYSVDVDIDAATASLLEQTSDGESVDISVSILRCAATRLPDVAIRPPYESLDILGSTHDVNSIDKYPDGFVGVLQVGAILKINVTVRVGNGGSAVHQ
jgi:hypothetical protein